MSAYKEFQLTLENIPLYNSRQGSQEIAPLQNQNQINNKVVKARGLTHSLPNEIIYLTVEDNLLQVTSLSTTIDSKVIQSNDADQLVKRYQFTLPSLILDSISIIEDQKSANSYSIIIFTDNGHVQSFTKDSQSDFTVLRGSYQDDLNIVSVEYLYRTSSEIHYAFGSSTGKIFISSLAKDNGRLVLSLKQTISLSTSNLLLRVFQDANEKGINSMQYIGNNLLCFIDTKFSFTLFNLKAQKAIYSHCLIENAKEDLLSSKIIFDVVDFSKQQIELHRAKIFNVLFYLEYSTSSEIVSLELWFKNIPENSLNQPHNGISSDELYNVIELGTGITLKNKRVYVLKGHLIDMDIQGDKLWLIIENNRRTINYIQEGKIDDKYSIGIITLKQNDSESDREDNAEIAWDSENLFDYQEKTLKNVFNVLEQINSNNCLALKDKNEMYLSLLTNEEYFQKETIVKVFNDVFKQTCGNKTEVIAILKQQSHNLSLDHELIIPLLQEELKANEIVSTGWFNNKELLSMCLIRKKGIGFIKPVGFFERIDQETARHEHNIRNIIFNNSSKANDVQRGIEEKIEEYSLLQCKYNQSNALYVILALIRIYLTEINLLITNEDYLSKIFKHNPNMFIQSFIKVVFEDNLSIQYNNLGFLDFIHSIIKDLITNYSKTIENEVDGIISEFKSISDETQEAMRKYATMENNSNFSHFNDKYCEIISKMALNKVESLFHISRDLLSFASWQKVYSEFEDLEESNSLSHFEEDIQLLFTETFTSFLFSNHTATISSSINSKTSSLNAYPFNKEMTFLDQIVLDNVSKYKVTLMHQNSSKHIDILIASLLPALKLQGGTKNALYQKAYSNKDFSLMSLLNKIQNDPHSLQMAFIQLLCQAKIKQKSDTSAFIEALNFFYLKLLQLTMTNERRTAFKRFEDFYSVMTSESYGNSQLGLGYDVRSSILMKGFKLIERQLMTILTKDEMNQFYLLSFNWIYPKLQSQLQMNQSNDKMIVDEEDNEDIGNSIVFKDFIINFIKSAIQVDIRYALSCYSTIKQRNPNAELITEMAEFFSNYLINTFQFNSKNEFVSMLIGTDYELLSRICLILEAKCKENLDNANVISFITLPSADQQSSSSKKSLNYFSLLFMIYSQMRDYQLACLISYKYSKALDNAIITDNFPVEMLLGLYQEKITALNNSIMMLKRCTKSNQHFLYESLTPSILKPISIDDLIKEKKFSEAKVVLLKKYELTREFKEVMNEEMISKIKKDNSLLNVLFQFRMYDIVIGMNMISFVNETQGKILIYNLISNLLGGASSEEGRDYGHKEIDYGMIRVFINQVKEAKCDEYAYQVLEALMYFNSDYQVNELIAFLKAKNSIRLIAILLKYAKFTYLINVINHMFKHKEEIPIYISEQLKAQPEQTQIVNERLALRKCKELIDQLDKVQ